GLRRRFQRQRRRGDGEHDPRAARLRGQLEGDSRRRRNAAAGERARAVTMRTALLLLGIGLALTAPAVRAASDDTVRAAIAQAVAERFRAASSAQVVVDDLRVDATEMPEGLVAVPDPGARTGRPAQFTLRAGGRHVGIAVASVTVSVPHVRTTAAV